MTEKQKTTEQRLEVTLEKAWEIAEISLADIRRRFRTPDTVSGTILLAILDQFAVTNVILREMLQRMRHEDI